MKLGVTIVGLLAIVPLGGCPPFEPNYRVSAVEYDPGLIGTWRSADDDGDGDGEIRVEARSVTESVDRLNEGLAGKSERPNAYRVIAHYRENGKDETVELHAYTVRAGELTLLGFQVSHDQLQKGVPLGFVLPVHWVLRIQREGDTVTVRPPEHMIGWVPLVTWLDAKPSEGPLPDDPAALKKGIVLTNSADRLIEAYTKYGAREGFWDDKPIVFTRVIDPAHQKAGDAP